jgi:hypothetical protein
MTPIEQKRAEIEAHVKESTWKKCSACKLFRWLLAREKKLTGAAANLVTRINQERGHTPEVRELSSITQHILTYNPDDKQQ